jgi:prepilin-type processing-associated H-X9-DG protein
MAAALVALLVPAIGRARVAAERMSCGSHLKQVGVALYAYHQTYDHFPENSGDGKSMYTYLMPFYDARHHVAANSEKPIRTWQCPARGYRTSQVTDVSGVLLARWSPADYAAADHPARLVDRGGRQRFPGWYSILGSTGTQIVSAGAEPTKDKPIGFSYQPVDLTTVARKDGLSLTLLLAHKSCDAGAYQTVPGWNSDSFHVADCRRFFEDRDHPGLDAISSPHPQAMPVLFADGSVRSARYQKAVNPVVPRLWAYNDGTTVLGEFED